MFNVLNGSEIQISRGDTGAIKFTATGYSFEESDRAMFSVKNGAGTTVFQRVCAMSNNAFTIYFRNQDTDSLPAGGYNWDVRYVIHPYYDANGTIVDGDQVITPKLPQSLTLLTVVGEI